MKTKQQLWVYVSVSILLGVAAVVFSLRWLNAQVAGATTSVVVAASAIAPGERLDGANLRVVSWPVEAAISGSISHVALADGRVAVAAIQPGEPILEARLAPSGSRAGLNALIAPGYRAMTVKVNEVAGVAGFALPGNYVDILVTVEDGNRRRVSKIVLERIPVLAVAQEHAVKDESKPRLVSAVTLEVSPSQAERLDLARSIGSLSMVLRNQTDLAPANSQGALIADVLGHAQPKPKVRLSPPTTTNRSTKIEVIRGVVRSTVEPT